MKLTYRLSQISRVLRMFPTTAAGYLASKGVFPYESGKVKPQHFFDAVKIANALGITVEELEREYLAVVAERKAKQNKFNN